MTTRFTATAILGWATILAGSPSATSAPPLEKAQVTQIVKDVKYLGADTGARAAKVGDIIQGSASVATGFRSRAELSFPDETLLRLGSNTTFSIGAGTRQLDLKRGTVLLQTAPGGSGVNIRSGSITAAIRGSLGLFSIADATDPSHPDTALMLKLVSIHGAMSLVIDGPPRRVLTLQPGQILFMPLDSQGNPTGEPRIETVDVEKLLRTSKLLKGFPANHLVREGEIDDEVEKMKGEKRLNQWTEVTVIPNKINSAHPGASVIGLGALVKPFVPPPPPPPVITVKPPVKTKRPPPRPPVKQAVVTPPNVNS